MVVSMPINQHNIDELVKLGFKLMAHNSDPQTIRIQVMSRTYILSSKRVLIHMVNFHQLKELMLIPDDEVQRLYYNTFKCQSRMF